MKLFLFSLFGSILLVVSFEPRGSRALSHRLAALRDWPSYRNYPPHQ